MGKRIGFNVLEDDYEEEKPKKKGKGGLGALIKRGTVEFEGSIIGTWDIESINTDFRVDESGLISTMPYFYSIKFLLKGPPYVKFFDFRTEEERDENYQLLQEKLQSYNIIIS